MRPRVILVSALGLVAVIALSGCAPRNAAVCNLPDMQPPNVMVDATTFLHEHPDAQLTVKADGATLVTLHSTRATALHPVLVVVGSSSDKSVTPSPKPVHLEVDARAPGRAIARSSTVVSLHNAYAALRGACRATFWTATVHVSAAGRIR